MTTSFVSVTEIAGDEVTSEQVERLYHRYFWAAQYCMNKNVVEVACGTGQGLGFLSGFSKSLEGADISEAILDIARNHYGNRILLQQFDVQAMPYDDASKDVIVIFEAIYYVPRFEKFVQECQRVLRPGGIVLIATANKDLYDFSPSPHSYTYYGVVELAQVFRERGFSSIFFGYMPIDKANIRQKILRPIKKAVVSLGLMPKTMKGKKLLKRLVFGKMLKMPNEITQGMCEYSEPQILDPGIPDKKHKVIYCAALK